MSAARALFVTEGYADTGMEVVARKAAVSTATLYAYFPSKAHLFRTTVEELIGDIADDVAHNPQPAASARTRLTAFARAYAAFCANPVTRAVLRMVAAERRRFNDSAETLQARTRHEIGAAVIQMISELADRGDLQVERPSWAASQLLGLIEHPTLLYGLVNGDDASAQRTPDVIAEEAVTTFLARYGVRERAG
ncbi:MAG TPA: TetR/AcrR family transcriptional regulator [Caulobacteraceae bacterium]|nr:TetR/AcrR family transcriptional regulator [Caulobacteraceae bacterium]